MFFSSKNVNISVEVCSFDRNNAEKVNINQLKGTKYAFLLLFFIKTRCSEKPFPAVFFYLGRRSDRLFLEQYERVGEGLQLFEQRCSSK